MTHTFHHGNVCLRPRTPIPTPCFRAPHCGCSHPSPSFDEGSPFASPSWLQSPFRDGAENGLMALYYSPGRHGAHSFIVASSYIYDQCSLSNSVESKRWNAHGPDWIDIWKVTVAWITSQVAVLTQMNSVTLLMRWIWQGQRIFWAHKNVFRRMKAPHFGIKRTRWRGRILWWPAWWCWDRPVQGPWRFW